MSEVVLSVPVDAGGVDPLLASLEKINENLKQINLSSKGSFDIMSKGIEGANKKLAKTDKTFGDIFKKMKLSGLMSMGGKVIGAGAGLLGISTGAMLFGSLMNAGKNIGTTYAAKGVGLSTAEMKSLEVASEKMTGKKEDLPKALSSLTDALNNPDLWGKVATLGLNAEQLKGMNPEDALEAVLNAVKGKGQGIGSATTREAFNAVLGGGVNYNVAESSKKGMGTELSGFFDSFLKKFSGVDYNELNRGAEALIDFNSQLDIVSSKIGAKLADPLSDILTKLTPALDKFATAIATFLDNITQQDIDNFCKNIEKVFKFIGGLAGGILTDVNDTADFKNKTDEAFAKKDVAAIAGLAATGVIQKVLPVVGTTAESLLPSETDVSKSMDTWKQDPVIKGLTNLWNSLTGKKDKPVQQVNITVSSPEAAAKVTNNLNNNIGVQGVKK